MAVKPKPKTARSAKIEFIESMECLQVAYRNLSSSEYAVTLLKMEFPPIIVDVVVDADAVALRGDLNSSSRDLSTLIGRPTTTLDETVESTESPRR